MLRWLQGVLVSFLIISLIQLPFPPPPRIKPLPSPSSLMFLFSTLGLLVSHISFLPFHCPVLLLSVPPSLKDFLLHPPPLFSAISRAIVTGSLCY